jgi:hypothetical protein
LLDNVCETIQAQLKQIRSRAHLERAIQIRARSDDADNARTDLA